MISILAPTNLGYYRGGAHFPSRVADERGGFCLGTRRPWLVGLQHRSLGYRNVLAPIEGGARCLLPVLLWRPEGSRE
jgi:hypothetical protein